MIPAAPSKKLATVCCAAKPELVAEAAVPLEEADEEEPEPEVPLGLPPPEKLAETPELFVQWEL